VGVGGGGVGVGRGAAVDFGVGVPVAVAVSTGSGVFVGVGLASVHARPINAITVIRRGTSRRRFILLPPRILTALELSVESYLVIVDAEREGAG